MIMCGFAGFLTFEPRPELDLPNRLRLAAMALFHRGPDQSGEFFDDTGTVGMGFCRLSIIDLTESGRQPMMNEDGSLVLTFNGEIYNYLELRAHLINLGHHFRSRTDSEVVLHLYDQYGSGMLQYLDGMFAFVIYDRSRRQVFVARDRFGKKPLYYAHTATGLYWASEFRALVLLVPDALQEDSQGFYHYVTFNCYPREYTFYRQIRKLLPGYFLQFEMGKSSPQIQRYYRLSVSQNSDSLQERDEHIRTLFTSAVKKRLMSDVPIGFFLSGGIDSSAIVIQASQFHSDINTFSIGVEGDPFDRDETGFARLVAQRCGARHNEAILTEREYADLVLQTAWALDEPLNLSDAALLNHLSRVAASTGVKVLLSGEGSDEIFFGYTHYWPAIQDYYSHRWRYDLLPDALGQMTKATLRRIAPEHFGYLQRCLNGREFFLGGDICSPDAPKQHRLSRRVLDDPDLQEQSESLNKRLQKQLMLPGETHLSKQIMLNQFNLRLPDLLMMRIDKATMANSIETRCPFLDRDLVEYGTSIPFEDLFDGRLGKMALRRAFANLLPAEIASRGKVGFGGGTRNLTKPVTVELLRDVIASSSNLREYYAQPYLDSLVNGDLVKHCYEAWNVATFALWKERFSREVAATHEQSVPVQRMS
jgi:asparagine synthase (glutamine-hydrolysing)